MKKIIHTLFCLLFMTTLVNLPTKIIAGIIKINSTQKFRRRMMNRGYPFSVVLFYEDCRQGCKDRDARIEAKELLNTFRLASDSFIYREADVQFLAVNVAKCSLDELRRDYDIDRMPAYMLFRNGDLVRNGEDKIVRLVGDVSVERIKRFVNDYLDDDMQDRVDMKADERARKAEALRYYWATSPYWYGGCGWGYGCGYPYWGGCGPCGPRASVGFGFCI